jgi:hypothetical protein
VLAVLAVVAVLAQGTSVLCKRNQYISAVLHVLALIAVQPRWATAMEVVIGWSVNTYLAASYEDSELLTRQASRRAGSQCHAPPSRLPCTTFLVIHCCHCSRWHAPLCWGSYGGGRSSAASSDEPAIRQAEPPHSDSASYQTR